MTKTAVYLRISRDREGTYEKPDAQRARLQEYLTKRHPDWTTSKADEYLDDDRSASGYAKKPRPDYERLIAAAERGEYDAVIVDDLDRLFRKPLQCECWIEWLEEGDRVIVDRRAYREYTGTAADKRDMRNKVGHSAGEGDQKSERLKDTNRDTALKGMPHAGRIPFGWKKDRITPKKSEQPWVEFAIRAVAEGQTLYSIARQLNAQGIQRKGGSTWTATRVADLVRRPSNVGILIHLGQEMPKSKIKPLIKDKAVWQQAIAVLDQNVNSAPGRKPTNNWLSSLMLCGVCGAPMASSSVRSRGSREWHYQCSTKTQRNQVSDGKRHVAIKADAAHTRMIQFLHGWYAAGAIDQPRQKSSANLVFKISEVQADIDAATDALMVRGANKVRIQAKLAVLDIELQRLNRQRSSEIAASVEGSALTEFLAQITRESATTAKGVEVEVVGTPGLEKFTAIWNDLENDRKRQIIKGTFVTVVKPGRGSERMMPYDMRVLGDADPLTYDYAGSNAASA